MFPLKALRLSSYVLRKSPLSQIRIINIRWLSNNKKSKGHCDTKFQPILDCFESNLNKFLNGYGGALCIYFDNQRVVDIYGGQHAPKSTKQWEQDTFTSIFSNTKALSGLAILHQIDKGLISLDDPLCSYWPQFRQNGKDDITVRDVLSHQSGCCIVDVKPQQPPNYKEVIKALETMEPTYAPKKGIAYHTFTIGFFVNELTKRVSKMSAHQYFEKNIKKPLGIKETELSFINPIPKSSLYCPISMDADHPFFIALNTEELPVAQAWAPYKDLAKDNQHETDHYYNWDIGSVGFGNARGLATISNKILNNKNNKDVISDNIRKQCLTPVITNEECQVLGIPLSVSLSHFACDNEANVLLNGEGVFSAGIGQSFGFLNEKENIAIGYCPSRGHEGLVPPHCEWIANELFPVVKSVI